MSYFLLTPDSFEMNHNLKPRRWIDKELREVMRSFYRGQARSKSVGTKTRINGGEGRVRAQRLLRTRPL